MDRRKFIGSIAALGLQGILLDASGAVSLLDTSSEAFRRKKKKAGLFDENLVAIISDLHTNPGGYQPARLERTIADILALNPCPRNIIALGDLAYLTGKPSEYALLKEILKPLEGSGIRLTMAMGNHDKRKNFAEAFPEYAAASLMED
ncbi:MAG: metallophosphoesterase, partial [Bacteroidales bacterium]|nr:metallophosphoesterase [Bacteroidales bacterium]